MKDLQLLEYLPDLQRLGIKAIKIEGRMRSADYVYKVAKAYRLALDNPTAIPEAKAMLVDEGGRDKTDWYFSGKSSFVTTGNSFTGKGIGVVISSSDSGIVLSLHADIKPGDFIRFQGEDDTDAHVVSIKHVEEISEDQAAAVLLSDNDKIVMIPPVSFPVSSGSLVYKINQTAGKQWQLKPVTTHLPKPDTNRVHQIAADIGNKLKPAILPSRVSLFFRISDPAWLPIIATAAPKAVLYPVYSDLNHKTKLRLIPELPYFTPEAELITLSRRLKSLIEGGCHSFAISRLSQRNLFKDTKSIQLFSNEQVYALNDAAVLYLQSQAIKNWILPLENDFPNLVSSKNRDGIVPLYFYPNLFFSRQPANVYDDHSLIHGKDRLKYVQDKGMVKVVPSKPICNFSFYTRLWSKGYSRFLIDLSYDDPDQGFMDNLLSHLDESKNLPDTTRFNMKQGLW
jgi:putative protease